MERDELAAELAQVRAQLTAAKRDLDDVRAREWGADAAAELQHRMRNLVSVIRSVFSRTMDTATSLEEATSHFHGRLDTISRYEMLFLRDPGGVTDLEGLLRDELLRFGFSDGPQVTFEGPAIGLPYDTAEAMGLAVHELATNAVKFGALASDQGRLEIRWEKRSGENGSAVILEWCESRVAIVTSAPMHVGFGREFIEQGLPYQHDAVTSFSLQPGGVRCRIELIIGHMGEESD